MIACSHFPAERLVRQRLKQVVRLPFRFPLLRAQAFKLLDDVRKFLLVLERQTFEVFETSKV